MSLIRLSSASADVLGHCGRSAACCTIERRAGEQVEHADDAVERRADLVAHVGQELALGLAGGLGRLFLRGTARSEFLRSVMSSTVPS